ncbi:MAG: hypothetical protein ACNA7M_15020 [Roseovarius sp.]
MKRYGIRITLPEGDPMRAPHLLGDGWEQYRWFESAEARDRAFEGMQHPPPYYRRGDVISQVLEKVEGNARGQG